jgi:hypothetical protein
MSVEVTFSEFLPMAMPCPSDLMVERVLFEPIAGMSNSVELTLTLTEEELSILLELLTGDVGQTRMKVHDANSRPIRQDASHRLQIEQAILEKLAAACAA